MSDRASKVSLLDELGNEIEENNPLAIEQISGFRLPEFDEVELGYSASDDLTNVKYKSGGSIVAELTLVYDSAGKLISVTKN